MKRKSKADSVRGSSD